jgi:hypothetical protein
MTLFLSLVFAPMAGAQNTKAYAPDNLQVLAVPDQIRVIEREYAEQSGGRRIPDDQLEFYVDQVESGWSFSRIKEDIAQSLGGGTAGWRPPAGGNVWVADVILCESRGDRYVECQTPFRGAARVANNLSSTRCIEGVNFGSRPGLIWVRGGCRARFVEDDRYTPGPVIGGDFICESRRGAYVECRTTFRGAAVLAEQLSGNPCIEGRTWGNRNGLVWVNGGCRGRFAMVRGGGGGGGPGYNVTCNSEDGRYRTCAWDRGRGMPVLIEQTSDTPCVQGRTWGFDRREGLWVDRGCRGRFGSDRRF